MSRKLTVEAEVLGENFILGLRETAAKIDSGGATALLDHTFGYGGLGISLDVTFEDGTRVTETIKLSPMVRAWMQQLKDEHALQLQDADPLFSEDGVPNNTRGYVRAMDEFLDARNRMRDLAEAEVWRYAPADVATVVMRWTDDPDQQRLALDAFEAADGTVLMEDALEREAEGPDAGRRWDAVDSLLVDLADDWEDARSRYPSRDAEHFTMQRPTEPAMNMQVATPGKEESNG